MSTGEMSLKAAVNGAKMCPKSTSWCYSLPLLRWQLDTALEREQDGKAAHFPKCVIALFNPLMDKPEVQLFSSIDCSRLGLCNYYPNLYWAHGITGVFSVSLVRDNWPQIVLLNANSAWDLRIGPVLISYIMSNKNSQVKFWHQLCCAFQKIFKKQATPCFLTICTTAQSDFNYVLAERIKKLWMMPVVLDIF